MKLIFDAFLEVVKSIVCCRFYICHHFLLDDSDLALVENPQKVRILIVEEAVLKFIFVGVFFVSFEV